MEKEKKEKIMRKLWADVIDRDKDLCSVCGSYVTCLKLITPSNELPNYGIVKENVISFCSICDLQFKRGDRGFDRNSLYKVIGSSVEIAIEKSKEIGDLDDE